MLIAQGLGEYGALTGGGGSGLAEILDRMEYSVSHATPSTWVAMFVGFLVVWFVFFRSR